ncbi:MAG: ArsC/Spx/MgsR family protein [Bacteroidota bacterium]
MKIGPDEMIIIFNNKDNAHKEAIAYANILSGKVKQYDVTKFRFNESIIENLASRLQVEIQELLDVDGELFSRLRLRLDRINNRRAMDLILDYPELLRTPILLTHNRTIFIRDKHDIMNLAVA